MSGTLDGVANLQLITDMSTHRLPGAIYDAGTPITHLDEHLRWMRRAGRSDRTLVLRRATLRHLAEFLDTDPFTATEHNLETWQDSHDMHQIRQRTSLIRPYYGWIHARGYRADNPAALLITPPPRRGTPRPIKFEDLARAVADAPDRIRPWLLLAAWSGLRAKEIAELRVEDFTHHDGRTYLHLTRTKGERPRTAVVPGWVWAEIWPMLPASGLCWRRERGFGRVTPQHVSQYANAYLHRIGIDATLHCLRHFAGTEALKATGNIRLVQEFLGHLDLASTQVYTAIAPVALHQLAESLPTIGRRPLTSAA